jgi:phage/conjugal plasmid C-4 type zinc finger TraR family protein
MAEGAKENGAKKVPDKTDQAQDLNLREIEHAQACALDRTRQMHAEGREECAYCGDPIPAARRRALPGVLSCVDCEELREMSAGRVVGL